MKKYKIISILALSIIIYVIYFNQKNTSEIDFKLLQNPYKISPMSGVLEIDSKIKTDIEIIIRDVKTGEKKIVNYAVRPEKQQIEINGFFPEKNLFSIEQKGLLNRVLYKKEILFKIPDDLPEIIINKNLNDKERYYLIDYINKEKKGWIPFIIDSKGRVRWYLDFAKERKTELMESTEKTKDGNMVSITENSFIKYSLGGRIINEYKFPDYKLHHDWVELSNGNILILVTDIKSEKSPEKYRYDNLIEVSKEGKILRKIDLKDVLDKERRDFNFDEGVNLYLLGKQNWLHSNSLDVNKDESELIISGRHQGVFILDLKTTELKGIIAPHKGWEDKYKEKLYLPVNQNLEKLEENIALGLEKDSATGFDWTWGQHQATYLENDKVLIFDNGDKRNFKENNFNSYSRVVEYKLDQTSRTINQIQEIKFNSDDYSWFMSGVIKYDENYLITLGTINDNNLENPYLLKKGKIIEMDAEKNIIFEAEINFKNPDKGMKGLYRSSWFEF